MKPAAFLPFLAILLSACAGEEPFPPKPQPRPDPPVRDVMDALHRDPIRPDEPFRETRLVREAGRSVILFQVNRTLPPRVPEGRDQVLLVLEGNGVLVTGGGTVELKAGDLHGIPSGTAWSFANKGPGAAAFLVRDNSDAPAPPAVAPPAPPATAPPATAP